MNLLKYLANDLRLSVVVVGTADASLALESDAQMQSRFTPCEIPRWRENDEFRGLLAAFERVLLLRKPSDLSQRTVVQFMHTASAGLTGEVSRLLNEAAELAILDRSERITLAQGKRWRMPVCEEEPWPVAPRPFPQEPLGGWLGRVASRYRMSVEQLAATCCLDIDFAAGSAGWLQLPPQPGDVLARLAYLARLDVERLVAVQIPAHWTVAGYGLPYCHRCLVLNPLDVTSPCWRRHWLDPATVHCRQHADPMRWIRVSMLRRCRNFDDVLRHVRQHGDKVRQRQIQARSHDMWTQSHD